MDQASAPRLDLTTLQSQHVATLGRRVRELGQSCRDERQLAERVISSLYDALVRPEGGRALVLARLFVTERFADLEPPLQRFAEKLALEPLGDDAPCLTLLASRGYEAEWNDPAASHGHRAVPLADSAAPGRLPMLAALWRQLGLDLEHFEMLAPRLPSAPRVSGVVHVERAPDSPLLPQQRGFVVPYGVQSALGFGGVLPDGRVYVVALYSGVPVSEGVARSFELLGLHLELAWLEAAPTRFGDAAALARIRSAALQELLDVQEQHLVDWANALADSRDDERRRREEAARQREAEALEKNRKLERIQNAMLNVIEDLREAREGLERTVTERTEALREVNAELSAQNTHLQQQMAEREAILASLGVGLYGLDREGRCTFINPAGAELVGLPAAEILGRDMHALVHHTRPDGTPFPVEECPIYAAFRNGQSVRVSDDLMFRVDGTSYPAEYTSAPILTDGEVVGAVVVFADISVRKAWEERLRRKRHLLEVTNQALAASNEELEQFAYVASHDLQEPLRTITGHLQLLQRRHADALPPDASEFVDYAIDGARRMKELIESLLDYSRITTRAKSFRPVSLEEVLRDVREMLAAAIATSGARIEQPELPTVEGDPMQLRQLFQNLLSNAIKFAGDAPPRITLTAERIEGGWALSVADRGVGFDPKFAESVFRVFRRLQRTAPGTGIGLAICRKIVERHGGTIRAVSAPGEGATFHFTLLDAPPQDP